jgi:hypothetical protein
LNTITLRGEIGSDNMVEDAIARFTVTPAAFSQGRSVNRLNHLER